MCYSQLYFYEVRFHLLLFIGMLKLAVKLINLIVSVKFKVTR